MDLGRQIESQVQSLASVFLERLTGLVALVVLAIVGYALTPALREGPLTGAADSLTVRLSGRGGHTSRPHLTQDLTYALATLVTELPATLSRRLDPRAGVSLVWGIVRSGSAKNVIPASGEAAGTVRMLDAVAWAEAEELIRELIAQIVAPYGVEAEVDYVRGVPPVVNETASTHLLAHAVEDADRLGVVLAVHGQRHRVHLEPAHRVQDRALVDAGPHRELVPDLGVDLLRLGRGEELHQLHGRLAVRRRFGHRHAGGA